MQDERAERKSTARGFPKGLEGLRVLSLESRRAEEMARLIRNYGGHPMVAPSMREVPLSDNREALDFASRLLSGEVGALVLLTGGGTRVLLRVVESSGQLAPFLATLRTVPIVARGPKPVAVLAEFGIRPTVTVPEPNTWRELLHSIDINSGAIPIAGRIVAVQEYGVSNDEFLHGLAARGASVLRVPVYDWQLPEDLAPLQAAARSVAAQGIDVALFTTSVQVRHLMQVAEQLHLSDALRQGFASTVVASIGPVTSEELRRHEIPVDLEPSHPKMGFLIKELAERSAELLSRKRVPVKSQSELRP